ncbi:MAG: hypothetical protein ACRC9L_01290 [Brevinema sp.]
MKIIIGVFDRQLSCKLSIVFSEKKILPIEAESIEEIPALLSRHEGAILLTEEISPDFHRTIKENHPNTETFLLYHSSLSVEQVSKLRFCGLRGLVPYSDDVHAAVEILMRYLSMLSGKMKLEEKTCLPADKTQSDAAIYLPPSKIWLYGHLEGFNGSKVAVTFPAADLPHIEACAKHKILLYMHGLKIKAEAEILYVKNGVCVFRYCQMSAEDREKLMYYINYCRNIEVSVTPT